MNIGSLTLKNRIVLAPMAGITDLPYRRLMKSFGAGLVFTEMVSANGLIHSGRKTRELLRSVAEERPLGIQLFGSDPAVLAEAAKMVEEEGELLDLNLGCPVKKVTRSGAGCSLMRDPARAARIVAAVRRAVGRPLTVKIRSGWDGRSLNYLEIARVAAAEGADAVILHPRTRAQGFSGRADWDQIRRLKESLTVPVIGSGDIFAADDALAMLGQTSCDAVMVGRGGCGNPWLIRDILARLEERRPSPPTIAERQETAGRHLELFTATFGEKKAVREMRKHLCWYSRGLPGAATFRAAVNRTGTLAELRTEMERLFLGAGVELEKAS